MPRRTGESGRGKRPKIARVTAGSRRRYRAAAERIAELVASGAYAAGSMLPPERQLSEALGVSRSTLREAIAVLETLGIVVVRANHGIEVASDAAARELPWRRDLVPAPREEQFAALRLIELEVAGLAAEAKDKSGLPRLERLLAEWDVDTGDGWSDKVATFHRNLAQQTGNRILGAWVGELWAATSRSSWEHLRRRAQDPTDFARELRLHQRLLNAVSDGSAPKARERMAACFRWREVMWFERSVAPSPPRR